jgi:hypothetical protein
MYQIGIMIGASCSPCCTPCGCPAGETLPDAITLSLSGLTQSAIQTGPLLSLSISSCFGSGATGTIVAPGGTPDDGFPISSVSLTSGGGGYAVLGRIQPVGLSLTTASGSGAEFEITLASKTDDCNRPFWEISAVTVAKAGSGYADGGAVSVSLGSGEVESVAASLTLNAVPTNPTLQLDAPQSGGTGAVVSVSTKLVSQNPNRWGADAVTITTGGTGYTDGAAVTFSATAGGTTVTQGAGTIRTKRVEPQAKVLNYGAGSGAIFSPMLAKVQHSGRDFWEVEELIVNDGGADYVVNDFLIVEADADNGGVTNTNSVWQVASVSPLGAIISVSQQNAGLMFGDTGEIDAVDVSDAGAYYGPSDEAGTVTVNSGGVYFKESTTVPPLVAEVTCAIVQELPSDGAGAQISAAVDTDPQSPSFGSLLSLTLAAAGGGYLGVSYQLLDCCVDNLNGRTLLLKRDTVDRCKFVKNCCGQLFTVTYRGADVPPTIAIGADVGATCTFVFDVDSDAAPFACDGLSFSGTDVFGGTATVAEADGGEPQDDTDCPPCCRGGSATACDQSECLETGGVWWDFCTCGPCDQSNCPDDEYVVVVEMTLAPEMVPAGGAAASTHTFNLTNANGYADATADGFANMTICGVFFEVGMNSLIGRVTGSTRRTGCYNVGVLPLPSAQNENGLRCPIDGATQLCATPNGAVGPAGLGPQQLASLLATVTVIKA